MNDFSWDVVTLLHISSNKSWWSYKGVHPCYTSRRCNNIRSQSDFAFILPCPLQVSGERWEQKSDFELWSRGYLILGVYAGPLSSIVISGFLMARLGNGFISRDGIEVEIEKSSAFELPDSESISESESELETDSDDSDDSDSDSCSWSSEWEHASPAFLLSKTPSPRFCESYSYCRRDEIRHLNWPFRHNEFDLLRCFQYRDFQDSVGLERNWPLRSRVGKLSPELILIMVIIETRKKANIINYEREDPSGSGNGILMDGVEGCDFETEVLLRLSSIKPDQSCQKLFILMLKLTDSGLSVLFWFNFQLCRRRHFLMRTEVLGSGNLTSNAPPSLQTLVTMQHRRSRHYSPFLMPSLSMSELTCKTLDHDSTWGPTMHVLEDRG